MRCPCGGIILADTDEWTTPLCDECYCAIGRPSEDPFGAIILRRIQTLSDELTVLPWWRIYKRWELATRIKINQDLLPKT